MTVQEYFDTVYRPLKLRGRSENTSRLYGCTIRTFGKFLGRPADLSDLADELTLARFLEHRQATRSAFTAEKERSQLMSMARLASERRLIERMPSCEPCVLPEPVPMSWSEDELRRLYAEACAQNGLVAGFPAREWWPLVISVAFESGERIGAIMTTPRESYRRPHITFEAGVRKGRRRGRVSDLSAEVCDRIDAMLAATPRKTGQSLFAWDRGKTYLWDKLKSILERAGLAGKRVGFQQVRRSAISHFARAGGDPVQLAGHAQASTTKRWYLDPRYVDRGPRACDLLPKLQPPAGG
jgi:hypothetical protein